MGNNNAIQDPLAEGAQENIESLQAQIKRLETTLKGGRRGKPTREAALTINKELSTLYKELNETIKIELASLEAQGKAATRAGRALIKPMERALEASRVEAEKGAAQVNESLQRDQQVSEKTGRQTLQERRLEQASTARMEQAKAKVAEDARQQRIHQITHELTREFKKEFGPDAAVSQTHTRTSASPTHPLFEGRQWAPLRAIASAIADGSMPTLPEGADPDSPLLDQMIEFVDGINAGEYEVFPKLGEFDEATGVEELTWNNMPTVVVPTQFSRGDQPVTGPPFDAAMAAAGMASVPAPAFTEVVDTDTAFERAAEIWFNNRYYGHTDGRRISPEEKTAWIALAKAEMEGAGIVQSADQWFLLERQFGINTPDAVKPQYFDTALPAELAIGDAIRGQLPDRFDSEERQRRFDNKAIAPNFDYIVQELSRGFGLEDNLGTDAANKEKFLNIKANEILKQIKRSVEEARARFRDGEFTTEGEAYESSYEKVHNFVENFENEKPFNQQFDEWKTKSVGSTQSGIRDMLQAAINANALERGEEGFEFDWDAEGTKKWLNQKALEIYTKYNEATKPAETGADPSYTKGNQLLPDLIEQELNKGVDGIVDEINEMRTHQSIVDDWLENQDLNDKEELWAALGWKDFQDAWLKSDSKESFLLWMEAEDHSELLGAVIADKANPTDIKARWERFRELALSSGKLPADYTAWQLENAERTFKELDDAFLVAQRQDGTTRFRDMANDAIAGWDVEEDARRRASQFGGRAPGMGLEGGPSVEAREAAEARVIERRGGWDAGAKQRLNSDLKDAEAQLAGQTQSMAYLTEGTSEWQEQETTRLSLQDRVNTLKTRKTNRDNDDMMQQLMAQHPVLAQAFASGDAEALENVLKDIGNQPNIDMTTDLIASTKQAQERQGLVLSDEQIALRTAMGIPPVHTGFPTIAELQQEQEQRDRSSLRHRFRTTKYTAEGNEMEFFQTLTAENFEDTIGGLGEGEMIPGTNLRNTPENRTIIQDEFRAGRVLKDYDIYDPETMTRKGPLTALGSGATIPNTDIPDTLENREKYRESERQKGEGAQGPHEVDDTPVAPAPEIAQFTTRRRGGGSGF